MEKEIEKKIERELFGTAHKEEVTIIETPVDIRIVCSKVVIVLDKIQGKFAIVEKKLLLG